MANNVADTDPAEGSREVIEHELARQDEREKREREKQQAQRAKSGPRSEPQKH